MARDMRGAEVHGEEQRPVLGAVLQHRRRVARASSGSSQKREFQCGRVNLQGMMHDVAAEQRALARIAA
jgi:hypothetical protein